MRSHRIKKALGVGILLALATAAVAGGRLRLPADYPLPQSPDSPGVVTFKHGSHVDKSRPDCSGCHPSLFKILRPGVPAQGGPRILHKEMDAGRQCGACHDGKAAHSLEDCTACHQEK